MSLSKLSSTALISGLSPRTRAVLLILILIPVYMYYLSGLTANPPGFYIDEAAVSYNAYTIYKRGEGEFGHPMPLYFPVFPLAPPLNYLGYVEPIQIYSLAALNFIFPPSVGLSRGLSATAMFLTALLLGFLAFRISNRVSAGFILGIMALLTPWLFEMGRLAFGASLYPFTVAVLLTVLYNAVRKDQWTLLDCIAIALALALSTYTYAIGRMLGPLFAFGLLLFAVDLKRLKKILTTWAVYGITLVPMLVVYLQDSFILKGRFDVSVGYITAVKSYWQIFVEFLGHYAANISPYSLLLTGDQNLRHHITGTAPIYAATLLMALAGIVIIAIKHRRSGWWRYVIFGLIVSIVPASLTRDDFHMLRLSAFPVFLLVLTISTLTWLLGAREAGSDGPPARTGIPAKFAVLGILIALTIVQFISFANKHAIVGPTRDGYFDAKFPLAFAAALEHPERPIYLTDQNYYHAFWQAITRGIDLSNFVRLPPLVRPPANSLVLSGEERCEDCEIYFKDSPFIVYKTLTEPPPAAKAEAKADEPATAPAVTTRKGSGPGQLSKPRGICLDSNGKYFVADADNGRIQKFNADGDLLSQIKVANSGQNIAQPHGVAANDAGEIFVTDPLNHVLLKFGPDGTFEKEWRGPDSGFYGPRDIELGPGGTLFIVDQGRTRIVKYDPVSEASSVWGTPGAGEGQFADPTGIAVGGGFVFVADTVNARIQVFDLNGNFVRQWAVPELDKSHLNYPDVAYDEVSKRVFVSRGATNEVLVFDPEGEFLGTVIPDPPYVLNNPSSIAIRRGPKGSSLFILSTGNDDPETGDPSIAVVQASAELNKQ